MKMITLILSLPTENATARQRVWRALKASGAAVLRDGVVYHIPPAFTRALLRHIVGRVGRTLFATGQHAIHAQQGTIAI